MKRNDNHTDKTRGADAPGLNRPSVFSEYLRTFRYGYGAVAMVLAVLLAAFPSAQEALGVSKTASLTFAVVILLVYWVVTLVSYVTRMDQIEHDQKS